LIAEAGGVPVGTVRADLGEEGWLLSWTVAPEHRGRGHGKTVVAMAAELLAGPLLAEIKTANAASVAIAEAAGLSLVRQAYGVSYYRRA
jgi:ribosomal protein S18 acetylase RimI-like enzyme